MSGINSRFEVNIIEIINKFNACDIVEKIEISRYFRAGEEREALSDIVVREHNLLVNLENGQYNLRASPEYLTELIIGNLICEGRIKSVAEIERIEIDEMGKNAYVQLKKMIEKSNFSHKKTGYKPCFEDIFAQSEHLMESCDLFYETGALHSASLWIDSGERYFAMDIGRHNAIDKVVGMAAIEGKNLANAVLYSSGRAPSDMVQKAINAGVAVFASRSAPTAESARLAQENGLILLGFVGKNRMNIYTNDW